MMTAPRILIADDHALSSDGLQRILEKEGYDVLPPVHDGIDALAVARAEEPDIAILDHEMPGASGLEVLRELKAWGAKPRVVILTGREAEGLVLNFVEAGADAVFFKTGAPEALCDGLARVLSGERLVPETVPGQGAALSRRELQTLEAIAQGCTNPTIAEQLGISIKTVESHRASLMRKLDVHSTASLIVHAVKRGLISV